MTAGTNKDENRCWLAAISHQLSASSFRNSVSAIRLSHNPVPRMSEQGKEQQAAR